MDLKSQRARVVKKRRKLWLWRFSSVAKASFFACPFKLLVRFFARERQKSVEGYHRNRLTSSPSDSSASAMTRRKTSGSNHPRIRRVSR